jgi:hypothetical protein
MKTDASNQVPKYLFIGCAFIGAFIGFMVPETRIPQPGHAGILSAFITFELNYINLITTVGAVVLVYWLLKRKARGREPMMIYGALGFVCVKLLLASLRFARNL